jgi:hypothetical protein
MSFKENLFSNNNKNKFYMTHRDSDVLFQNILRNSFKEKVILLTLGLNYNEKLQRKIFD